MKLKHWAALWAALTMAVETTAEVDPALAAAIKDLAARIHVNPGEVEVESRQAVTWPDGSAGCPAPGMAYAQVLTDGSRLILAVDGQHYHYHSQGNEPYFYCAEPSAAGGVDR